VKTITWGSAVIVSATGAVLGFFVWYTYFDYVMRSYPLEFTHAQWMTTSTESPQGYFRKVVHSRASSAGVDHGGSHRFICLYVNGNTVDTRFALSNVSDSMISAYHPWKTSSVST
jgi:hypothetical protein